MQEKVLMKGNEAIAEAAILAGCRHYLGYPITPQTEVAAYMAKKMPKIGGTFLQAESEIAAINMVYGVAATGKRAMTSSSSPGIALKCEGISYLAGADLPAVIVNVQRCGLMEMRVAPPALMTRSFSASSVSGRPPSTVNSRHRERSKCVFTASSSRAICSADSVVGVPPPM